MNLRHLRFRQRFFLLGFLVLAGFVALLLVAGGLLERVMVNGTLYEEIAEDKDLVADLLPPPHYLVEPFLLCYRIAANPQERDELLGALEAELAAYKASRDRWRASEKDSALKASLAAASEEGDRFVAIAERFIRSAQQSDDAAMARLLADELPHAFRAHKARVAAAITQVEGQISAMQDEAASAVVRGKSLSVGIAVSVLLLIFALGYFVMRPFVNSLGTIGARMKQLSEAEADLTARIEIESRDEVGELAESFNDFVARIAALVHAVRRSSVQLTSTSTEMAATSREQQATVANFGSSASQIAASVHQISATGTELMATMDEVRGLAAHSASLATTGRSNLDAMRTTMGQLTDSSSSISSRLAVINTKTDDISSVVTAITKVADQTNLLSVNAAIEAEKAGEYGRGFLVVAQEIRRLADQTAAATLDIGETVAEMETAVSAGVMEMDKFGDHVRRSVRVVGEVGTQLAEIIEQVEGISGRFEGVSEGMRSQAQGADQINDAMRSLNDTVQTTVTSLREVASVAEDLRSAANALNQELGKFRLEG
ncbi:MAG: methyl-accepting chemotaxis protein [Planctomycetota bacterium]|nr:methyl-accepting chemotaxis protein [Planctomycetota bacterium]